MLFKQKDHLIHKCQKQKLESYGIKVPEWKDGLKRYLEEEKKIEE